MVSLALLRSRSQFHHLHVPISWFEASQQAKAFSWPSNALFGSKSIFNAKPGLLKELCRFCLNVTGLVNTELNRQKLICSQSTKILDYRQAASHTDCILLAACLGKLQLRKEAT
jgi:hypothetical protein